MDIIWGILAAITPGLIVGVVMARFNRRQKERDDEEKAQAAIRLKNEILRLELLIASAQLSYAAVMALQRGSTNGEVEPAVEKYKAAMASFREFEHEHFSKAVSGD